MMWSKCGSPNGEHELHCTIEEKKEIEKYVKCVPVLKAELQRRIDEETSHINHPKQIYKTVSHNCEYNRRVCEILMEILK